MRILTIGLALTTILLAVLSFTYHQKIEARNRVIDDRELQITGYHKIIDAIVKTEAISVQSLFAKLEKDFKLDSTVELYESENGYYINLYPKENAIDNTRIWDYMGGFVVEYKKDRKLKAVNLYKP